MIKKLFLMAVAACGLYLFYTYFLADTFEPFFKKNKGNVDLLGTTSADKSFNRALEQY